jgi:hypothetical protein
MIPGALNSFFETLGKQYNRDQMMSLIAARNDEDFVLDETYAKGQSRGSNVHTGSNRSNKSSAKSSAKGAFSGINLSDVFINESESNLFLRRWVISDEFLNSKLFDLARGDIALLNAFLQHEVDVLKKIRNLYGANKTEGNKNRDERKECQPVVQLFMLGLLKHAGLNFNIQKTVAAANNAPLDLELELNQMENGARSWLTLSGRPDLFILRGEFEASLIIGAPGENVETVIEIKPPFGPLYHTSHRQGRDQLTCEVEALAQSLHSKPTICMGLITDLFAISLHVRVKVEGKIYHCITNRVCEQMTYIKYLVLICCCTITPEDVQKFFLEASKIDVSVEEDTPAEPSVPPYSSGKRKATDAGQNQVQHKKASSSSKKRSWNFEDEEEVDAENVHYLLAVDARVRGVIALRECDLNTM